MLRLLLRTDTRRLGEDTRVSSQQGSCRFGILHPKFEETCASCYRGTSAPIARFLFESARHLMDSHICALEEDGVTEERGLVYKKVEGQELTNWTAFELPEVTMVEKYFFCFPFKKKRTHVMPKA